MTAAVSRLRPADVLRTGAGGLTTRRLRAALSLLGVAIGIAALVAVVGISRSSRATLLAELDALGTNLLRVQAGQTLFGESSELPVDSERMIARIGPVESTAVTVTLPATVRRTDRVSEGETGGIVVRAADPELLETVRGELAAGRFLDAALERVPAVVMGASAARQLGIRAPGALVWLGERWFTVVGILAPARLAGELDRSALVGRPVAEQALDAPGEPSTVYVRAHQDRIVAVRAVLARTANPANPEEVSVERPSDALEARAAADRTLTALLVGLGAVALLVGGIGIANVMVVAVLERRTEIGLRRALGATRRHVRLQFLVEAVLLGGLGGALGVAIGVAIVTVYARTRGWPVAIEPLSLPAGVAAALVVGTVAGGWPAARAARVAPHEALSRG